MMQSGGRLLDLDDDGLAVPQPKNDRMTGFLDLESVTDSFDPLRLGLQQQQQQQPEASATDHQQPFTANELISAVKSRSRTATLNSDADDIGLSEHNAAETAGPARISSTDSTSLNGYIRHDSFGAGSSSAHRGGSKFKTSPKEFDAAAAASSTSDDDDDDVFDLKRNQARQSLLKKSSAPERGMGSNRRSSDNSQKRVHFSKSNQKVSMEPLLNLKKSVGDKDPQMSARVIRGRNWKTRLVCVCSLLSAFVLAAGVVSLVLWATDALPVLSRRTRAVCANVTAVHLLQTVDPAHDRLLHGHARAIQLPDASRLLLFPIGDNCDATGCESASILAVATEDLTARWLAELAGTGVASFDCATDITSDGIPDCAVTTTNPSSLELLNGETGASLARVSEVEARGRISGAIALADMNSDDVPEFMYISVDPAKQRIRFHLLVSEGPLRYKEPFTVVRVNNATTTLPPLMWASGEGARYVGLVVSKQSGIFLWDIDSVLRGISQNFRRMFVSYTFASPLGVFVDLDLDGVAELVACVDGGDRLVAVDLTNRTRWTHNKPDWHCVPGSITPAKVLLSNRPAVAVAFEHIKTKQVQVWVLDGRLGVRRHRLLQSASLFTSAPLVAQLAGYGGQDKLVDWQLNGTQVQLVANGYPWHNASVLYSSAVSKAPNTVTNPDALFRVSVVNQRYTGVLYGKSDGSIEHLFVTNSYEGQLTMHKLQLRCDCSEQQRAAAATGKKAAACASFSQAQPWDMYAGHKQNFYFS